MAKSKLLHEQELSQVTVSVEQELRKKLLEWLHEEVEIRVRMEVEKEVKRIFREMGRI